VLALLETIKVVEYQRGDAAVRQTTEVREEVEAVLHALRIAPPLRFHSVVAAPAAQ